MISSYLILNNSTVTIKSIENSPSFTAYLLLIICTGVFGSFFIFCICHIRSIRITNRNARYIEVIQNVNIFDIDDIITTVDGDKISINSLSNKCIICQIDLTDNVYKFKSAEDGGCDCNIIFHKECIKTQLCNYSSKCPNCKSEVEGGKPIL